MTWNVRALRLDSAARNDFVLAAEKQADQGKGEERATVSCAMRGAWQSKSFHKVELCDWFHTVWSHFLWHKYLLGQGPPHIHMVFLANYGTMQLGPDLARSMQAS